MKEELDMGILSGLFRSRDKPTDRTAGSSYSFFLGGTASGKYVTERSAMQMTAVYCCGGAMPTVRSSATARVKS